MLTMDPEPPGPSAASTEWQDPVIGLLGSGSWGIVLATEAARCRRYGRTATVVFIEVPELDEVAATWGSDVREAALTRIAHELRAVARSSDYVARIAERRFAVLLPETDEVAAVNFVERARARCDAALPADGSGRCRFGWADARSSRALDVAARSAESRLARDG